MPAFPPMPVVGRSGPARRLLTALVTLPAVLSQGCSDVLVAAGSTDYQCPAPGAGVCSSISEIHQAGEAGDSAPAVLPSVGAGGPEAPGPGPVRRTPPRVLRLWVAPHIDADGDHVGAQHIHMVVDVGDWVTGRE